MAILGFLETSGAQGIEGRQRIQGYQVSVQIPLKWKPSQAMYHNFTNVHYWRYFVMTQRQVRPRVIFRKKASKEWLPVLSTLELLPWGHTVHLTTGDNLYLLELPGGGSSEIYPAWLTDIQYTSTCNATYTIHLVSIQLKFHQIVGDEYLTE